MTDGASTSDGPRSTVLVVDDNEPIADTYSQFLAADHEVRTAYGGEEALELVGPAVDVVLLDRRMPDRSGDEVLAEIDERGLECRVVMVTAVEPTFDIVDMSFDAYVVKPVERAVLVEIVAEMLERANYDDDFRRFLSLASKKAALEREKDDEELATSEAYDRIQQRLADARSGLGIETDDLEEIFDDTVPDVDAGDGSTQSATE